MNIEEAKYKIRVAKINNSTQLSLSSIANPIKLSSNDLKLLFYEIKELKELKYLNLNHNNLKNVDFLKELKNLTTLSLSYNQLKDVSFLKELTKLEDLSLNYNEIENLDFLIELRNLKFIDLSNNRISKVSQHKLRSWIPLNIISEYFEIEETIYRKYENNPQYLWKLIDDKIKKTDEQKALLECRIVLIGQGNAGKTSLRQRLLDLPYEDKGRTEGIEIDGKYFTVRNQNVWINVWDFGGQEVYHSTHKFFFRARCLYILVVDMRAGSEKYIVKYWLRQIKELAKNDAPLIIVANKAETNEEPKKIYLNYKHQFDSQIDEFKELYPNIKAVHYVSTNTPLNIDEVKQEIISAIDSNLKEVFFTYNKYFAETRELFKVDKNGKSKFGDFISQEEFEGHLSQEARNDKEVVNVLDALGVFCHFKKLKDESDNELEKMYVLNPEWITKGVYKILSSYLLAENKGRVKVSDIINILNKTEYQEKHNYIIKLMERFSLCFKDDKYVIFPTWLPIEEKSYGYFLKDITSFGYKYSSESEMEKAITDYIVKNHKGIDENRVWRRGMVRYFEDLQGNRIGRALIKADIKSEIITITVEGEKNVRESHLAQIKSDFMRYHKEEGFEVKEGKPYEINKLEEIVANSTLPDKHLLNLIPELETDLANAKKDETTLLKQLKKSIDDLAKYKAKPRSNILSQIFNFILLLGLFLSIFMGINVLTYFASIILAIHIFMSNKNQKEWTFTKAQEQMVETEKEKLYEESGYKAKLKELK